MPRIQVLFVDSGTGGLPYMLHLKKKAPDVRCVYVGDTKNFPYGEKTLEQIETLATAMIENALNRFNPEIVVIACNTISVAALETLRARFAVPFVGTVPAIKLAASVTKNKCIGLLATRHTVEDPYTEDLINRFAAGCTVLRRGDGDLISFIEHHLFTASYRERCEAVRPAVDYFVSHGADSIVLACTHFIHLQKEFQDAAGSAVQVIDSRDGVARQALRVLAQVQTVQAASVPDGTAVPDEAVFVTGLRSKSDEDEYRSWCALSSVPFMGVL